MRMANDLDFNSLIKQHKDLKSLAKLKLTPEIEFKLKYNHYIDLDVKDVNDEMLVGYFDKSSSSQSSDPDNNSAKKKAEKAEESVGSSNQSSVSKSEQASKQENDSEMPSSAESDVEE